MKTLQECKDEVAKKYHGTTWVIWSANRTFPISESIQTEAAELYARAKWDQCHKETCELFSETMRQSLVFESYAGFAANMTKPEFKP